MKHVLTFLVVLLVGCTSQSTRQAMVASERSDNVRSYVTEQETKALKILAFRDCLAKLNKATTDAEREEILNAAWQQLDTFSFWEKQDLLARCYHIATVDVKLASDQGILNLLFKDAVRTVTPPLDRLDDFITAANDAATSQPSGD